SIGSLPGPAARAARDRDGRLRRRRGGQGGGAAPPVAALRTQRTGQGPFARRALPGLHARARGNAGTARALRGAAAAPVRERSLRLGLAGLAGGIPRPARPRGAGLPRTACFRGALPVLAAMAGRGAAGSLPALC